MVRIVKKSIIFRSLYYVAAIVGCGILAAGIYQNAGKIFQRSISCKNCNVILVSLDTLSADNLSCYGYERNTAPNLCAFADGQVNFPHAYANSTYTLPTHVTMFTGLYPSTHNIQEVGTKKLPVTAPFLPSILKDNGYRTIFIMDQDNPHMPTDTVYFRGIDTRFDEDTVPWSVALDEFENVISRGEKAFLFIHSYYVHPPYNEEDKPASYADDEFDWIFLRSADKTGNTQNFIDYLITALQHNLANNVPKDPADHRALLDELIAGSGNLIAQQKALSRYNTLVNEYRDSYDPLIRLDPADPRQMSYFKSVYDERIGKLDSGPLRDLLSFFQKPSIASNTIIIITSDHGEEFGEHGYISHSTLYNPNTHIVFTMAIPGTTGRRIMDYVQTADITPTIIDLLGIRTDFSFDGLSVARTFLGGSLPRRMLVANSARLTTLRLGRWKLFLDTSGNDYVPIELYDTEKDPKERNNLLFTHFRFAQNMLSAYKRQIDKITPSSF